MNALLNFFNFLSIGSADDLKKVLEKQLQQRFHDFSLPISELVRYSTMQEEEDNGQGFVATADVLVRYERRQFVSLPCKSKLEAEQLVAKTVMMELSTSAPNVLEEDSGRIDLFEVITPRNNKHPDIKASVTDNEFTLMPRELESRSAINLTNQGNSIADSLFVFFQ